MSDWEYKEIGECAEFINGFAFKSDDYVASGKHRVLTISNVQQGRLDSSSFNTLERIPQGMSRQHILAEGDFVISMTGNVARVCKVKGRDWLLNQRVGRLVPRNVDVEYFYQSLQNPDFVDRMEKQAQGGAQGNLSTKSILGYRIGIPRNPEEQRRIAELLSTLDEQIEQTEAFVHKNEMLLDGMLDALLLKGKRTSSIGALAELSPKTKAPKLPASIPFVAMEAVSESGHIVSYQHRPWADVRSGFTRFAGNDILVAKITPCFENGKGAIVPEVSNVWTGSTEFHVLRAKPGASAKWLYWHTRTKAFREQGAGRMTGSAGQQRVPRAFIEQFPVEDIVFDEQTRRASILDSLDQILVSERNLLEKLRLKKQGLMADLLTGSVRLKTKNLGVNL